MDSYGQPWCKEHLSSSEISMSDHPTIKESQPQHPQPPVSLGSQSREHGATGTVIFDLFGGQDIKKKKKQSIRESATTQG